jgi:uncharacterized protein (TIGR03085 family)
MTNHARAERHALCDLFIEVGPDAPTLCAGWTTRDLAAHLIVRETRPDAAAGILVPRLATYGDKVRRKVMDRDWRSIVDTVRSGPPRLSPMRIPVVDSLTNTLEFFVHHEDVRRANGLDQPRRLDDDLDLALLRALERGARLMGRKAPCGLTMTPTGGIAFTVRKGDPVVDVAGDIGELVLFIYGRSSAAHVALSGEPDAVEAVRTTRFGV